MSDRAADQNRTGAASDEKWRRAVLAAMLFSLAPWQTGGIALRARCGPVRDRWLRVVERLCVTIGRPVCRMPLSVDAERLLGGLDLGATLAVGRPVSERGLLAAADGGIVMAPSAERIEPRIAAHIAAAIDQRMVTVEREGLSLRASSRFGLVLIDEAAQDGEAPPQPLLDRVAFRVDLNGIWPSDSLADVGEFDIAAAEQRLAAVVVDAGRVDALCGAALALGIASLRAPLLALQVARASAAVAGRDCVTQDDISLAAAYVLAPRATRVPASEEAEAELDEQQRDNEGDPEREDARSEQPDDSDDSGSDHASDSAQMTVAAAVAAIPPRLLEQLVRSGGLPAKARSDGRAGVERRSMRSGRPAGVRAGRPRAGARLDISAMLRAAAPWQAIRRRECGLASPCPDQRVHSGQAPDLIWRMDDFRLKRFQHHSETATIFVVDASGSSALNRLAEAKGAVELLLSDCYVRRDHVALIAFRGRTAELLLPPTRALARAKRCLAGLPGGGGTPLAGAIAEARELALALRRRGQAPAIVFLTDGRANIARDGRSGRAVGEADAIAEARALGAAKLNALVIDTSPRSNPQARLLASELGGRYLPLPHADAQALARTVTAALAA